MEFFLKNPFKIVTISIWNRLEFGIWNFATLLVRNENRRRSCAWIYGFFWKRFYVLTFGINSWILFSYIRIITWNFLIKSPFGDYHTMKNEFYRGALKMFSVSLKKYWFKMNQTFLKECLSSENGIEWWIILCNVNSAYEIFRIRRSYAKINCESSHKLRSFCGLKDFFYNKVCVCLISWELPQFGTNFDFLTPNSRYSECVSKLVGTPTEV